MGPTFSIIIPAYNAERYINTTLESLNHQTYHDFEVLVVDDGSLDITWKLLVQNSKSKSNIHIFQQKNQGPLIARRTALSHAIGDYAIFLDSDDLLHNDALAIIAETIKNTNADIVSFPSSRVPDFTVTDDLQLQPGLYDGACYSEVKQCVCHGRFNTLWGKAIRISCIDTEESYAMFKGMIHGEDLFQLLPIIDCSKSLVQLDSPLYFYRNNDMSSTSHFDMHQLHDIVTVNRRLLGYAKKWGNSYYQSACAGEALQYINIFKIALSGSSYKKFKQIFQNIRCTVYREKCFSRWKLCKFRLDNLFVIFLLRHRFSFLTFMLLKMVDVIKKVRRY